MGSGCVAGNFWATRKKVSRGTKAATRKKNPVPPSSKVKIKQAIQALEEFTGHDAKHLDILEVRDNDVFFKVGELDGVLYTTMRDGEEERYIHEFATKARPQLIASFDGQEIRIIGGKYDFTERGIVDRK